MSDRPRPEELELAYRSFDEPLEFPTVNMRGEPQTLLYRGVLRVAWNSPRGWFHVLYSQRNDLGAAAYDEMRPLLADELAATYRRA